MKKPFIPVFLLCAVMAVAQQNPSSAADFILRLDTNGDGKVSRSEFDGSTDLFLYLDTNGDGYISRREAAEDPENLTEKTQEQVLQSRVDFIAWLDQNKDGRIASTEFPGSAAYFNFLDRNGDGYISAEEVPKYPLISPGGISEFKVSNCLKKQREM